LSLLSDIRKATDLVKVNFGATVTYIQLRIIRAQTRPTGRSAFRLDRSGGHSSGRVDCLQWSFRGVAAGVIPGAHAPELTPESPVISLWGSYLDILVVAFHFHFTRALPRVFGILFGHIVRQFKVTSNHEYLSTLGEFGDNS
jgi:hypothetical protein